MREHPQSQAAARSSARPRLVFTRPPNIPNLGHFPLQPLRLQCSSLPRAGSVLRVLPGCGARHGSTLHLFYRHSAFSCHPLPSRLLFSPSQKPQLRVRLGRNRNRNVLPLRMPWELEHLLSGFSSIRFASGLRNWHKSTLDGEWEEAKAALPARQKEPGTLRLLPAPFPRETQPGNIRG